MLQQKVRVAMSDKKENSTIKLSSNLKIIDITNSRELLNVPLKNVSIKTENVKNEDKK